MKIFIIFCILSAGAMSSVLGVCLYPPIHNLISACSVRNLTIYDAWQSLMSNDYSCNNSLSKWSYMIDLPFRINFTFPLHRNYKNSTFLLTVVDRTTQQLLWMVANITAVGTGLTPISGYTKAVTLKPYQQPMFNPYYEHQIEFLVFQQKSIYPSTYSQIVQPTMQPFYLPTWIDSQSRYAGVTFCGPVAGAYLRINDYVLTYTNRPHQQQSTLPPNKYKKNSASRFTSELGKMLTVAVILCFWFL